MDVDKKNIRHTCENITSKLLAVSGVACFTSYFDLLSKINNHKFGFAHSYHWTIILTVMFKIGCRNAISTSLERQRSSFELVKWRTWRSCGLTDCVPAAFSFRRLYVGGWQSNATAKYAVLCFFYRHTAVAPLPAGGILFEFSGKYDSSGQ